MDSSRLNSLQRDFLRQWFAASRGFFLTGGAVLVSILGAPRVTKALDLFTVDPDEFKSVEQALVLSCQSIGAHYECIRSSVYFRRYRLSRQEEVTLVDFVCDAAPQIFDKAMSSEGVLYDRPEEILVNKICAIVGRGESRDFLDVYYLHTLGFDPLGSLELAQRKDRGIDATALLYVLADVDWDSFSVVDVDPDFVRATANFFKNWSKSLAIAAFPAQS